jgi:hypothetical protein
MTNAIARIEDAIPETIPEAKRALAKLERDVDSAKTYEQLRRSDM